MSGWPFKRPSGRPSKRSSKTPSVRTAVQTAVRTAVRTASVTPPLQNCLLDLSNACMTQYSIGLISLFTRHPVYDNNCYSSLFWSDGTNGNAKIERSDLSGRRRTVLVSSAQGLVSPTTLVVDFSSRKLYWLDSAALKIGRVNFDGSQPFSQTISALSQVSAMTVYKVRIKKLLKTNGVFSRPYT